MQSPDILRVWELGWFSASLSTCNSDSGKCFVFVFLCFFTFCSYIFSLEGPLGPPFLIPERKSCKGNGTLTALHRWVQNWAQIPHKTNKDSSAGWTEFQGSGSWGCFVFHFLSFHTIQLKRFSCCWACSGLGQGTEFRYLFSSCCVARREASHKSSLKCLWIFGMEIVGLWHSHYCLSLFWLQRNVEGGWGGGSCKCHLRMSFCFIKNNHMRVHFGWWKTASLFLLATLSEFNQSPKKMLLIAKKTRILSQSCRVGRNAQAVRVPTNTLTIIRSLKPFSKKNPFVY